jgi:hypothetical protein
MRKLTPLIISFLLFLLYNAIDFKARNLELKRAKLESYQFGIKHGILMSGTALNNTLDMTNRDKKIYNETLNTYVDNMSKNIRKYSYY